VASAALIARKLMVLDYVLSQPDVRWLATEGQKVEFFTQTYGVLPDDLPQRCYGVTDPSMGVSRRYFAHKLPIFLTGDPPTVHLVALVLDPTARSLELFLADHARLLSRVPIWVVVAIAPAPGSGLRVSPTVFARHVHAPVQQVAMTHPDLRWYFGARRRIDHGDLAQVSVADIDRFKMLRDTFATVAHETLYATWLRDGDEVFDHALNSARGSRVMTAGRLVTHALPFSYSQFGSLPGVA
jgi:hypothetical protein